MAKLPAAVIPPKLLPMLAATSDPFDDASFLFDVKWDGVRALTAIAKGAWRVTGRQGADYTERYPELREALRRLPSGTMLDGELVAIRDGRPDFRALMQRHSRRPRPGPFLPEPVQYVVFDVLYFRGQSLLDRPLQERRILLQEHLPSVPCVTLCQSVVGNGTAFFQSALAVGHEGIVAKKLHSSYLPNQRGPSWRKIKEKIDLPCVVIGFRAKGTELQNLLMASLLDGKLTVAGAVELGIHEAAALLKRLDALRIPHPAVPCRSPATWVKPELFCTVRFCGWRPGGSWRDPVLLRWEEEMVSSARR